MKELQSVDRGIKRCLDFIIGGDGDPDLDRDQLRGPEARKRLLGRELKAGEADGAIELHPNLADLYQRKVENLQALLEEETARAGYETRPKYKSGAE